MPDKCTKEMIGHICELKEAGFTDKAICKCVGISQASLCAWKSKPKTENHLELIERLKKAQEKHRLTLVRRIEEGAINDWKAAAWLLERTYPDDYAKPEVQLARKIAKATMEREDDALTKSLKELAKTL